MIVGNHGQTVRATRPGSKDKKLEDLRDLISDDGESFFEKEGNGAATDQDGSRVAAASQTL